MSCLRTALIWALALPFFACADQPAAPDALAADAGAPPDRDAVAEEAGRPDAVGDAAPSPDAGPEPDAADPIADAGSPDAAPPAPDLGAPVDAGPMGCDPPAVAPIEAPDHQWTWIPIDGMRCANGAPTGVGVNLAPGARRLMIYLIGGGACWDAQSCFRDGRAAFVEEGFGGEDFAGLDLNRFWFFDRQAAQNPFADHHQVFVPYCTGDLHAGDRVARYDGRAVHHVGAAGMEAALARLAATAPAVERVVLVGGSAGGYGALLNWHRARAAFPCARVDMVDDAGAPIPPPHFPRDRRALWNAAWNFAATMPPDCPACLDDWMRLVPYNLGRAPEARGALLTAMADGVISSYMGVDGRTFARGVEALVAELAGPRFGAYLVPGDLHVLMAAPVVAGGQTVPAWLAAMQADDPAWGTVGPDPLPPCDALADCAGCAVCAAQSACAREFAACDRLDGCVDAVVCGLGCPAADLACVAGCAAPFPGIGEAALALYACVRCGECDRTCGACP